MLPEQKITANTEFDTWYGQTTYGERIAITEISLAEFLSLLSNVEDQNLSQIGKDLFEKSKTDNYMIMHDGTKLVKTIQAALDNGLIEISQDLIESAKLQNIKNGFEDADPLT